MGNRRSEVRLWIYVLVLGFVVLPVLGYDFAQKIPIDVSDFPKIVVGALLVWLFWILNLEVFISGFPTPVDTTPWFLLTLFVIEGPYIALIAYFLGTWFYSFFFPRALVAKIGTVIFLTIAYGFAFFLIWKFYPISFENPALLIIGLWLTLLLETVFLYLLQSFFHMFRDNISYKESFLATMSEGFVDIILIIVFPGLSFITIIFWKAHLYVEAVLLFIPFFLLRRAMQSVLKAVEEIANTIEAIVTVIEAKDPYTHYHCNRVSTYATVIAKFCGLSEGTVDKITRAARLHDIGKILLKDRVLKKDSRLTDEEYEHIKLHSDPNKILMNKIPDDIPLKSLIEIGRHHHERFDGKGYPDRLCGESIPVEVRVISMADAWDAMTSDRVYRPGLSHEIAMGEIEKFKGKQWDPEVVKAFQDAYQQGALEQALGNPGMLRFPQPSWKISAKHLVYRAQDNKQTFIQKLKQFLGSYSKMILPLFLFSLSFLLYGIPESPFFKNQLILFSGFAILLELWEMKFLKFPVFSPVDAVYLTLLFLIPFKSLFFMIFIIFVIRLVYDRKIRIEKVFQLFHRFILFALSAYLFSWLGFQYNGRLWIASAYFKNSTQFLWLTLAFILWAVLFAAGNFALINFETMANRRLWKISWHLSTLKRSVFFEVGFGASFALLLSTLSIMSARYFPYLSACFALLLGTSYPLLEYFRKVIEGNAKTLEALAAAADGRFSFYEGHTYHVSQLSREIGASLGLSEEELESLELSSRIFGLGNVGVPDEILSNPGPLNEEERRLMMQHVEISGQIAAQYSFYKEEVPVIWSHHERWDGTGYPSKLRAEAIPLGGRILALADSFSAMLSDRPYRKALSLDEAFRTIKMESGRSFDPRVVDAFMKVI